MIELIKSQFLQWKFNDSLALVLSYVTVFLGVLILSLLVDWIGRKILLKVVHRVIKRSNARWDDALVRKRFFHRLSHLGPIIILYLSASLFISNDWAGSQALAAGIKRFALLVLVWVIVLIIDAFLGALEIIYRHLEIAQRKPIKSYVQVAKIFVFFIGGILGLSVLLDRSPWAFLTGIGAVSAILLLVFRDSILGFVASIQNSAYDMVRMGDWIVMPKYGADGDVVDITLNTIKVQNWDKTISMVPTAALITEGIQNWRGMFDAGGRRIKRHINIDVNTIKFCDKEMIERFSEIHHISDYIQEKLAEVRQFNKENEVDTSTLVNGRHLTNVGTFRAYVEAYLKSHPKIHDKLTFLVRQLQPTETGLPIEIYVFTNDTRWGPYEGIQADIFDHILAVVPLFDLEVFQNTSGQNYKIDIVSTPKEGGAA